MNLKDRITEEFEKRKNGLLIFALLLGVAFFVNRDVEIKGLYMDDLYLWSCYGEQSFSEYVFPMGSTRFRFLYYLISWLEFMVIGNHVTWVVPINIVLNALIAYSICRIAFRMSGRQFVSIAAAVAYLMSRMAYYQIGQLYGVMESMGLWAAIGILWFLYRYVNERDTKSYLAANLLFFSASFIHERYMALFPLLLLALLLGAPAASERESGEETEGRKSRRKKQPEKCSVSKWLLLLLSAATAAAILLIRLAFIGTLSPAGTGGTNVEDTFSVAEAVEHAWQQVGFVFGVGTGPDYLCGMTYEDSPEGIRNLILACWVVLGIMVAVFLVRWLLDGERRLFHLKNVLLFLGFFALCIGASSVTIRVEMRWVYVVYAAALLFLAYMSAYVGKAGLLVFVYLILLCPVESFYRDSWEVLHLWPNQLRYNSLAEETFGKYGEDIFEKDIYIIGNSYEMSDFTAETFFKVYAEDRDTKDLQVHFIDSDFDLKEITDDMVILREDPDNNAYQDVTAFVKDNRFRLAYGSYEDGWIDEHAKIVFQAEKEGKVTLSCYYPGTITGNEICRITMNGQQLPDLVFTDNSMEYELPSAPYQRISLEFSCNFYVKDAKEKRGEENLAMVVTIENR